MRNELPVVYLARHGETAWTLLGQHTGLTDLPLTEHGELTARRLGERLKGLTFAKVFTSPLQRAHWTCSPSVAEIDPERPDWNRFRDGCPGGETPKQVSDRGDRVVARVRTIPGDVLLFTSGHFIPVLAVRWLGLEPTANSNTSC